MLRVYVHVKYYIGTKEYTKEQIQKPVYELLRSVGTFYNGRIRGKFMANRNVVATVDSRVTVELVEECVGRNFNFLRGKSRREIFYRCTYERLVVVLCKICIPSCWEKIDGKMRVLAKLSSDILKEYFRALWYVLFQIIFRIRTYSPRVTYIRIMCIHES